jgi:hypothetical protein
MDRSSGHRSTCRRGVIDLAYGFVMAGLFLLYMELPGAAG